MRVTLLKTVSITIGKRFFATQNIKKVTHCIFDMDGLLLDTETIYKNMITQICAKYGHKYTEELMMKVLGGTEQRLAEILCKDLKLPISSKEFRDELLVLGDTMLANAPFLDGAERLIRHLHKTKSPFALATSSSKRSVQTKVAAHREVFGYFHHMVMGSSDPEVKFGKPNPDIFLVAASRFPDKPKPEKCLVFEDSPHGVTAGISAGMQVVMVPDAHLDKKLTEHATIVLPTLAKFQPEMFGLPPFQLPVGLAGTFDSGIKVTLSNENCMKICQNHDSAHLSFICYLYMYAAPQQSFVDSVHGLYLNSNKSRVSFSHCTIQ